MTLPGGITTCTVTIGPAYSFTGEEGIVTGSIVADRNIVWSATGSQLFKVSSTVPASLAGAQTSLVVPHVDQPGFVDGSGDAVTNWLYTFTGTAAFGSRTESISKQFQVFQGQTTVDLDLIPDGDTLPGVTSTVSTGWRDVYSDGSLFALRTGNSVVVVADGTAVQAAALLIPAGFRPAWPSAVPDSARQVFGYAYDGGNDVIRQGFIQPDYDDLSRVQATGGLGGLDGLFPRWEYLTDETYPTTLPGIPAT